MFIFQSIDFDNKSFYSSRSCTFIMVNIVSYVPKLLYQNLEQIVLISEQHSLVW